MVWNLGVKSVPPRHTYHQVVEFGLFRQSGPRCSIHQTDVFQTQQTTLLVSDASSCTPVSHYAVRHRRVHGSRTPYKSNRCAKQCSALSAVSLLWGPYASSALFKQHKVSKHFFHMYGQAAVRSSRWWGGLFSGHADSQMPSPACPLQHPAVLSTTHWNADGLPPHTPTVFPATLIQMSCFPSPSFGIQKHHLLFLLFKWSNSLFSNKGAAAFYDKQPRPFSTHGHHHPRPQPFGDLSRDHCIHISTGYRIPTSHLTPPPSTAKRKSQFQTPQPPQHEPNHLKAMNKTANSPVPLPRKRTVSTPSILLHPSNPCSLPLPKTSQKPLLPFTPPP